jgi:hypothetical protein
MNHLPPCFSASLAVQSPASGRRAAVLVVGLACQVMAAVRQQVDGIRFADKRCAAVIVPED